MRDKKTPDDEYNQRLHIYADTPGLQQLAATVPASEKELNTPQPPPQQPDRPPPHQAQPFSQQGNGGRTPDSRLFNPYARIPAANIIEEIEEDSEVPSPSSSAANTAAHRAPSSASTSASASGTGTGSADGNGASASKPRDPIYAELAHVNTEDDHVERTGERLPSIRSACGTPMGSIRESGPRTEQSDPAASSTSSRTSSIRSDKNSAARTSSKFLAGIARKSDSKTHGGVRGPSTSSGGSSSSSSKTLRTHSRLDASLEIPATPRPKFGRSGDDDTGGVMLIRKVERYPEESTATAVSTIGDGGRGREETTDSSSGIKLTRMTSLEASSSVEASGLGGEISGEEVRVKMPVDPDIDAGTAILKKKQRFRRNIILIITLLMVLLIVVAAVIISLVIVTKGVL